VGARCGLSIARRGRDKEPAKQRGEVSAKAALIGGKAPPAEAPKAPANWNVGREESRRDGCAAAPRTLAVPRCRLLLMSHASQQQPWHWVL